MSVRYCVLPLGNPLDPTAQKKYYLIEKSIGHIDRNYLIKDMVRHTSLTVQEAATGIDYLFSAIPRFLELGFTVQIGRLGYFKLSIRSEGSATPEEAMPHKVRNLHLRFVPGPDMKEEIMKFTLEKFPE